MQPANQKFPTNRPRIPRVASLILIYEGIADRRSLVKSDEQLVVCYRDAGQADALDELVARHLPKVHAVILAMVLNRSTADELTQEVFLKVVRGLAGFRGKSRFATWLYRVTMNTVYGFLAQQKRSPVVFTGQLPVRFDRSNGRPECAAMRAELDAAIAAALRDLAPTLRAAIVLTAMQGLNVRTAAQVEGCSIGTMYWRIYEARRFLHRRLEQFYFLYHEYAT